MFLKTKIFLYRFKNKNPIPYGRSPFPRAAFPMFSTPFSVPRFFPIIALRKSLQRQTFRFRALKVPFLSATTFPPPPFSQAPQEYPKRNARAKASRKAVPECAGERRGTPRDRSSDKRRPAAPRKADLPKRDSHVPLRNNTDVRGNVRTYAERSGACCRDRESPRPSKVGKESLEIFDIFPQRNLRENPHASFSRFSLTAAGDKGNFLRSHFSSASCMAKSGKNFKPPI